MRPRKRIKDFQEQMKDFDSDEQDIPTKNTNDKLEKKEPIKVRTTSPRLPSENIEKP
jgi:hypothetical protein